MGDYAITITHALDRPVDDVDTFIDLLDDESAVGMTDTELSVSTSLAAPDTTAAHSLAVAVVGAAAEAAGIVLGEVVDVQITEWERYAASLEESNFPDLVSAPEVGEILGVSRQRVHQLINENRSFPPPLVRLGSGPIWLRSTIEAFDRSWTRKPGRPAAATAIASNATVGIVGLGGVGSAIAAGAYRCTSCGAEVHVQSTKHIPPCPSCGNGSYEALGDLGEGRERQNAAD